MTDRISAAEFRRRSLGATRPWSNARKATCVAGHQHDSKIEARVCGRLQGEYGTPRDRPLRILRQVRLPLVSIALNLGKPLYLTIDFAVYELVGPRSNPHGPPGGSRVGLADGYGLVRLIDAKGRRSREWARGKAALEASYGVKVEEIAR